MSSVLSQEKWMSFLSDSLNADTSASTDAEQRQEYINQSNQMYDDAVEQAKSAATEVAANLIGLGGIEAIRATKGLYAAGKSAYTRVQQVKDIALKIKAQRDVRTAKIENLKEQKFNEAQAKNAEIDPLTNSPRGPILDKDQFFSDADAAISKADTAATIAKVRGAVLEKINPYIDKAVDTANNVIDAVAKQTDNAVGSLTSTANNAADYLKNGFGQYSDTANQLKTDYLAKYESVKGLTDTELAGQIAKGSKMVDKFATTSAANGIEGIDEHIGTIKDLLSQGTRQSLAQAKTLYENLKTNVKTAVPYQKIQKAQSAIEDAKVSATQQKADVLNSLEESRGDIIDKINLTSQRLEKTKALPENSSVFRNAGVSKDETIQSIKGDIDNHNLDLENAVSDAHSKLGDIDIATSNQIRDLSSQIETQSDAIVEAAGGVTTDLLTRLSSGFRSAASAVGTAASKAASAVGEGLTNVGNAASKAASTVGEGLTAIKTAVAPVTEAVGALLTPVAVWQGALSAQNLIEGHDNGNLENGAMDAVNVRFGVGAAKQGVQYVSGKVQSLIGGEQNIEQTAEKTGEQATTDIAKTESEQLAENTGEGAAKSAGTAAGEDIAGGLAEAGGEEVAEFGIADLAANAIPVVGEIADVAMAGFAVYEGLKNLFDPETPPPPPPPPPAITQSVSFHGQAGVY